MTESARDSRPGSTGFAAEFDPGAGRLTSATPGQLSSGAPDQLGACDSRRSRQRGRVTNTPQPR